MSEKLELNPLTVLATKGTPISRSDASDREIKNNNTPFGVQFGGFLKSFIGNDKQGKSAAAAAKRSAFSADLLGGSSAKNSKVGGQTRFSSGAKANKANVKSNNPSLVEELEEDKADSTTQKKAEKTDDEVAEAAEEAARLIWGVLYPAFGSDSISEHGVNTGFDVFGRLAGLLGGGAGTGGLDSLGAAGVNGNAMAAAMDTANASAEMNMAAVWASMEEMLDSLPRDVLEAALAKTAGDMGVDAEGNPLDFNDIANALHARILDASVQNPNINSAQMLAELENAVGRQNALLDSEHFAELRQAKTAVFDAFKNFLKEKFQDGKTATEAAVEAEETVEETLDAFAAWAATQPGTSAAANLLEGKTKLAEFLVAKLAGEEAKAGSSGSGQTEMFAKMREELESFLHNAAGKYAMPGAGGIGQAGTAQTAAASGQPAASSMLDQIANIERIADVVKMGSKKSIQNLTLQLSPPELGKVTMKVEAKDGVVSAFLQVEKPETAAQLGANLRQLREHLKAQGIEVGELDVKQQYQGDAAGDWSGRQNGRNNDSSFDPDFAPYSLRQRNEAVDENESEIRAAERTSLSGKSALNLIA